MICKHIFDNILKKKTFVYTVEWFQVLLYNCHNLISVICLHAVYSIWPIEKILSGITILISLIR